jgi:dihydrofolate reductase
MKISLIAWMAKNRTIGINNNLPWDIPEDLAYFKKITQWNTIIMWKKTYDSIWRPLPNRRNIVLSRTSKIRWIEVFDSIPNLLKELESQFSFEEELFVIWWSNIYKQFLDLEKVDYIYLTEIKKEYVGDTFFPIFEQNFLEINREKHLEYDFVKYKRK